MNKWIIFIILIPMLALACGIGLLWWWMVSLPQRPDPETPLLDKYSLFVANSTDVTIDENGCVVVPTRIQALMVWKNPAVIAGSASRERNGRQVTEYFFIDVKSRRVFDPLDESSMWDQVRHADLTRAPLISTEEWINIKGVPQQQSKEKGLTPSEVRKKGK